MPHGVNYASFIVSKRNNPEEWEFSGAVVRPFGWFIVTLNRENSKGFFQLDCGLAQTRQCRMGIR